MTKPWKQFYSDEAKNFDLANMPSQTLHELIDKAAAEYADRPALTTILPNGAMGTITYAQLLQASEYFAAYLRQVAGLKAGDVVALMSPNCIGFGIASLGIAKAGCISTNVNPLYTAPELEHQLSDSRARVLVIIDLFGDKVDAVVRNTEVKTVVTLSLVDFFPALKKLLLGVVLKRVKKVIPDMKTAHITMATALSQGKKAAQGVDIASYSAHVKSTDTAIYQYTSGTTGRSKGAELSHQGILANAYGAMLLTQSAMGPSGETTLIALPLYHITAFALIFVAGVGTGGHGVLVPSPRPPSNLKSAFEKFNVTWFTGINTLFAAMMVEPWFKREMFENIRFCGSGGAAQQSGVAKRWEQATGVAISQGYGMTECCGAATLNPIGHNKLGTVGIPVPGTDVKIVDDAGKEVTTGERGEVIFKGPTIMRGYLNRPDATAEALVDGWLFSGDIGVMDKDGFVEIVDRKKDMILVSGFNVSPNEIEDVISKIPGVVQVGVIGIVDEKTGEVPVAYIQKNDENLTAEMVIAACKKGLTNYKVPKKVEFIAEVPITPTGKVLRRELRDRMPANA